MPERTPWDSVGALYTNQHRQLVSYLRRKNQLSRSEAEDIAHDSFLALARVMERGSVQMPKALLFRIADKRTATYCVKRGREVASGLSPHKSVPYVDVDHLIAPEVNECLDAMKSEDAQAWALTELRGCSQREAGDLLGVPQQTISDRANRAARALREAL